mmetsp:Transcript_45417/g.141084  ORF Transcript_45417/g.141084 Transcript_45417/m.141084 type:complete len:122 (-) Transcript_45417:120-485(-)
MLGVHTVLRGVPGDPPPPPRFSREALQQNKVLRNRDKLVTNCLEKFDAVAAKRDDYQRFHELFGKLGVHGGAAELACHQEELGQAVLGGVCRDRRDVGRQPEGLRAVWQLPQARRPRRAKN